MRLSMLFTMVVFDVSGLVYVVVSVDDVYCVGGVFDVVDDVLLFFVAYLLCL